MNFDVNDTIASADLAPKSDQEYCTDLLNTLKTKSAVIRYLTAENWERSRIAKGMNIIYQHVRNVQIKELKKGNK